MEFIHAMWVLRSVAAAVPAFETLEMEPKDLPVFRPIPGVGSMGDLASQCLRRHNVPVQPPEALP